MAPTASELLAQALERPATGCLALADDRAPVALPVARWLGAPAEEEAGVLRRALGPVLDIGCGPGRHVLALMRRGVPALGVEIEPALARLARRRGAAVLCGSVFGDLPIVGCWGTALLLDGNIGIGGDPVALLTHVRGLLRPGGRVLVEADAPGVPSRTRTLRLSSAGAVSAPFPWAQVGADGLDALARASGLEPREHWTAGGRWFARLALS